jgi:hypothetical protein
VADFLAQMRVECVSLDDARRGAAIGNRMGPATRELFDRVPPVGAVHLDNPLGRGAAGISMRAEWTLTPSGTTRGYHASTTLLALGTITPSRICLT